MFPENNYGNYLMWIITLNDYLELDTYLYLQQAQNNLSHEPKIEAYFTDAFY
jgi:hypothetical protein